MDTNKILNGVIGKKQLLSGLTKDADGDKVPNVLDCKPYNPNKQGFIHDAVQYAKEKISSKVTEAKEAPGKYLKERSEREEQERQIQGKAKEEASKVYLAERQKVVSSQAVKQAKARAQGTTGGFASLLNNFAQAKKVTGTSKGRKTYTYKKTTKYVKSGAGYKPVTTYKKVAHTSRPKVSAGRSGGFANALLGSSSGKQQPMSLLGSPQKKGKGILDLKL